MVRGAPVAPPSAGAGSLSAGASGGGDAAAAPFTNHFLCSVCERVQRRPADEVDYFALFNVPHRFHVDRETMERAYKALQRQLHPDKYAAGAAAATAATTMDTAAASSAPATDTGGDGGGDGPRAVSDFESAQEASSLLNAAYQVLRTPHLRAKYMLAERGIALEEDEGSDGDASAAAGAMSPEFLGEVMSTREEIESADDDAERLRALLTVNDGKLNAVCDQLDEAFGDEDLPQCRALGARLQFYRRIDAEVRQRL